MHFDRPKFIGNLCRKFSFIEGRFYTNIKPTFSTGETGVKLMLVRGNVKSQGGYKSGCGPLQ